MYDLSYSDDGDIYERIRNLIVNDNGMSGVNGAEFEEQLTAKLVREHARDPEAFEKKMEIMEKYDISFSISPEAGKPGVADGLTRSDYVIHLSPDDLAKPDLQISEFAMDKLQQAKITEVGYFNFRGPKNEYGRTTTDLNSAEYKSASHLKQEIETIRAIEDLKGEPLSDEANAEINEAEYALKLLDKLEEINDPRWPFDSDDPADIAECRDRYLQFMQTAPEDLEAAEKTIQESGAALPDRGEHELPSRAYQNAALNHSP